MFVDPVKDQVTSRKRLREGNAGSNERKRRPPASSESSGIIKPQLRDVVDLTIEDEVPTKSSRQDPASYPPRYLLPRLFHTRTRGRLSPPLSRNTITFGEICDKRYLNSAMIYSFYIAEDELFAYLPFRPFPGYRRDVPIYIGRDINLLSAEIGGGPNSALNTQLRQQLVDDYTRKYGSNFRAFFPDRQGRSGCAHSKFGVLVYEEFIRIFITSANMMSLDLVEGDNHWFVVDLPQLPRKRTQLEPTSEFEQELLEHMAILGCPQEFIDSVFGCYDYSSVTDISLVASVPGSHSGERAMAYGALRLKQIVQSIMEDAGEQTPRMEICTASLGGINQDWLQSMYYAFSGGKHEPASGSGVPPVKIYFITKSDVDRARPLWRQGGAAQLGAHLKWPETAADIKSLFFHYQSKDQAPEDQQALKKPNILEKALGVTPLPETSNADKAGAGTLFHQKFMAAFHSPKNEGQSSEGPLWVYIGSHNFSLGAWGQIYPDKRQKGDLTAKRLARVNNWELGVVLRGQDIEAMLEPGSTWEDVYTFDRNSSPFKPGEKPYNSALWATGAQGGDVASVFVQ